jgi:16S rRNA (uracil1498-N3)-methyltransferase
MELFYALPADCSTDKVVLRDNEFHHCARVLRKQIGDEVMVTDGAGILYITTIASIERNSIFAKVVKIQKYHNESSLRVTMAIGMLKNPSRIEFAVEKCTELGIAAFIPLHTTRVITRSAKIDRWKKIVLAAMKQSCRTMLPDISPIRNFEEMLAETSRFDMKLIAHETGEISTTIPTVMHVRPEISSAIVCIGPEGGFTDEEIQQAKTAGFVIVSLGQRRLRTETAAIAAASVMLTVVAAPRRTAIPPTSDDCGGQAGRTTVL